MLAKPNATANIEVRPMVAMIPARGGIKEVPESYSGATFHMSHIRAGMTAYKKASPGTTSRSLMETFGR